MLRKLINIMLQSIMINIMLVILLTIGYCIATIVLLGFQAFFLLYSLWQQFRHFSFIEA